VHAAWWSSVTRIPARHRLDAVLILLVLATFAQWADPDMLLDALWVVLAIGTFAVGFRTTIVRILFVMGIKIAYVGFSAATDGQAIELELFDLTDWPLVVSISVIVALKAERVAAMARQYAGLYRQASERLVSAHEVERARLARDLHDGVGQTLTAALLALDAGGARIPEEPAADDVAENPTDPRHAVSRARSLVASALEEVRDVAAQLRPRRIQETGLGVAIRSLAESAGLPVHLGFPPERLPPGLLDPGREIDVYRVVQEALGNAGRHGRASEVWIRATVGPAAIRIEVRDDGIGFDRGATLPGLGIAGMEERAHILGGRLKVRSKPGAGTTVVLEVPINAPDRSTDSGQERAQPVRAGT
jgi:signal transduction histidine kinase